MKGGPNLECVNYFFRAHGTETNRCHEPTEKCNLPTIRSHSIPSSTVLARLSRNGHLVAPKMTLKFPPPATIEFGRIGINKATTFSGLCSEHDNGIFRPIDQHLPDLQNEQHLFLLAYRAILREYHVVLQNAVRFQATYQKRVEVGLSASQEPCDFGMFATEHLCNAFECYEFKRRYDKAFLAADWKQLVHHIVILENQPPSVAVSSMFSLDDIDAPETPRVTLSVFPKDTDVAVVFSAIQSDAPFVEMYLDRLLSSTTYYQKYLISKLILQSCDNFVIDPAFYDTLSQSSKDAICEFYVETIRDNAESHEDSRLYLF